MKDYISLSRVHLRVQPRPLVGKNEAATPSVSHLSISRAMDTFSPQTRHIRGLQSRNKRDDLRPHLHKIQPASE